jgi:dihydrofolate reductase
MVISPNGYICKPDGNEDWIDQANWDDFVKDCQECDNFIVGRTTYEIVTGLDDIKAKHKVIVTTKDLKARPGYTVVHSPQEAVDFLNSQNVDEILLAGGGVINGSFAKAGLIDEVEFVVEPYLVGAGKPVFIPGEFEFKLVLDEVEKLSKDRVRILYKLEHQPEL